MSKHAGSALSRRAGRTNIMVTSVAVLVGLWLGLTAPSVSPVAPAPPPPVAAAAVVPVLGP